MATRVVTFTRREYELFVEELKARVAAFFEANGLSTKANAAMVVKTFVMMAALAVPYALILSNVFPPLAMLALAMFMGVAVAGIGFAVSHDALHGAYSSHPRVNALVGLTFDILGANGYMWRIMHNVVHHTYTNIHGVDEDLDAAWFLRLSPRAPWRRVHRFQHWYALAPYSLATLNWVFLKDYKYFLKRRVGPYEDKRHGLPQWLLLFGGKLFYYGWAIVVPLLVVDLAWWQLAIGFVAMHLTTGVILSVVFQLAHVVEQTAHPLPDREGVMEHAWVVHEMLTTANFSMRNRILSWYVGGLNFQIEHHLFPKTCSVHYPRLSAVVREVAEKYGIPYHHNPTLWRAIRSHWRMLRELGRPPLEPVAASA
ncbi:MAG: acyl-CoA desaturase [Gemmatimonadetes bacterium]|nr:acyl-CoA desaturase [Gemmatimonadota bacterium]